MANEAYLLTNLHRLASGQDENFITEAFAFVLRYLIVNEPESAVRLLQYVTDGFLVFSIEEISTVDVKTQISTELGRPDLVLSTDSFLVYVEIKVDASFGDCQLNRYRTQLEKCKTQSTKLVALTRYPLLEDPSCGLPDFSIRWHHLADFLSQLRPQGAVSRFIVSEFLHLLTTRGLTMEKVSWEMISGVKSFISLVDMLAEALAAKKMPIRNSAAQDWRGFYIEDKKFFVGMYFSDPGIVVLNTEVQLIEKAKQRLKTGKFQDGRWRNELDLTAEDVHFFARTRASQIQCLEQFIEDSLAYGRTLI